MTNQNTQQDNTETFNSIRPILIRELRAEGLTQAQQDTLMEEVGEALLERVTTALIKQVPSSVLLDFSEQQGDSPEASPADVDDVLKLLAQHVPNAEEVIQREVKAGLEAYHSYLDSQGK